MKLKEDIKARWLAALRSGEYVQGKQALRRSDVDGGVRYCCLGVLCDLSTVDGVGHWAQDSDMFVTQTDEGINYEGGVLPMAVVVWAFDLSNTAEPVLTDPRVQRHADGDSITLSYMNDTGGGYGFGVIADAIEADL